MIVYLGDENLGLSNEVEKRVKSHKKLIDNIKKFPSENPQNVYSKILAQTNEEMTKIGREFVQEYQDTYFPSNPKQIANVQYREKQKEKISKDVIYNCYEIAINIKNYIISLKLIPELQIIFGNYVL